jgi:hypothetical protein
MNNELGKMIKSDFVPCDEFTYMYSILMILLTNFANKATDDRHRSVFRRNWPATGDVFCKGQLPGKCCNTRINRHKFEENRLTAYKTKDGNNISKYRPTINVVWKISWENYVNVNAQI